jgi:glycosyltransferase involved in cell wall biosynthesis
VSRFAGLRLAFVVPRYGTGVVGGAETLARGLAERLVFEGADVSVFTTCAENHFTWENALPEGMSLEGGVSVRRFRTNPRQIDLFHSIQGRIAEGISVPIEEQMIWLAEGVNSDGLLDALAHARDRFDAVFLLPYLFGTTFWAARIAGKKSVLIPCLHDEPFSRLPIFRVLFEDAGGFMFNAEAEKRLAERLFGLGDRPSVVVGLGFDPEPPGNGERFRRDRGVGEDYLLYFGRKEEGKGVLGLVDWFMKARRRGCLKGRLVLAGDGKVALPADARGFILDLGFLTPEEKRDAVAGARAVCQLSRNESFSIVLMESWLQGTPVIVHADCPVTREHCEASGGGFWVSNPGEFSEAAARVERDRDLRAAMGRAGRAYVLSKYGWNTVMDRVSGVLDGVMGSVHA